MNHAYPLFLDVSNRPVVIVGGGAVAARKASSLLAAGATQVRAIAPKFVRDFPQQVEKTVGSFDPQHLSGAALAFAATDSSQINDAVVAEAHRLGILVNRADSDDEEPGDFSTPALFRAGHITVAVSASGSPALAAALRDVLAGVVTDQWVHLAQVLHEIRPKIRAAIPTITRRREIFRALAGSEAAEALASGGTSALWAWTRHRFPELPPLDSADTGDKA